LNSAWDFFDSETGGMMVVTECAGGKSKLAKAEPLFFSWLWRLHVLFWGGYSACIIGFSAPYSLPSSPICQELRACCGVPLPACSYMNASLLKQSFFLQSFLDKSASWLRWRALPGVFQMAKKGQKSYSRRTKPRGVRFEQWTREDRDY
jgi:hypothetical protein